MISSSKLQVRLISSWTKEIETETSVFSSRIPTEEADALLCEWAPSNELFTFPRRKAWYCCEPACQFEQIERGRWPEIRSRLQPSEFLFHAHPDPEHRVPHITHFASLEMNRSTNRMARAIAIVSNHGGSPRHRHPQIAYRNRLITNSRVDLFGRSSWTRYRRGLFSWPRPPRNYQGEIPGDWPGAEKRELQAKYGGAVCLENMCEPHYFTEKLTEAVAAGCVPVYRAHPTLRDGVLGGAFWIDPADFDDDPKSVLEACLDSHLDHAQEQNNRWLNQNPLLPLTRASAVFERIGNILATS